MRAMFVGFFSPSLALKTRVGSFFNISINNSHVHSGSLGMSAAMKMLKQKTKIFFNIIDLFLFMLKNHIIAADNSNKKEKER